MSLRDFILNNFRWKLSALILATLVWFIIQFAIWKGFRPAETPLTDYRSYTFVRQPIRVLTQAGQDGMFRVIPETADVIVRSTPSALNRLTDTDIKLFVNLVDAPEQLDEIKPILVYVPESVEVYNVRISPAAVKVQRVTRPQP